MRFALYLLTALLLSLVGSFCIIYVQVIVLNGFDFAAVTPASLFFVGLLGVILILPIVVFYIGAFVGLFLLMRGLPAPGFLAGVSAAAMIFSVFMFVFIFAQSGYSSSHVANAITGFIIVLWCGFASEAVRRTSRIPIV